MPTFLFLVGCGAVILVCHLFFAPETLGRALALDDEEVVASQSRKLSAVN